MRFDITAARAKTMAGRLQNFIAANPKSRLTRSSAIEAVARMLGFNSRNEMLARLDDGTSPTGVPETAGLSRTGDVAAATDRALSELLNRLIADCAGDLVDAARAAAEAEDDLKSALERAGDGEETPRVEVEDSWARKLRHGAHSMLVTIQGYCSAYEDELLERRGDVWQAAALALVTESVPFAEAVWDGRAVARRDPESEALAALRAEADTSRTALRRVYQGLVDACAQTLAREALRIAPDAGEFREAIHAEDPDSGTYALILAEEAWVSEIRRHTIYPAAIETFSEEVESSREIRVEASRALALALVNDAVEPAEDLWHELRRT